MLIFFQVYGSLIALASLLGTFKLATGVGTFVDIVAALSILFGVGLSAKLNPMGPFVGLLASLVLVLRYSTLMVRDFSLTSLALGLTTVLLVPISVLAVQALAPKSARNAAQ